MPTNQAVLVIDERTGTPERQQELLDLIAESDAFDWEHLSDGPTPGTRQYAIRTA